MGDAALTVAIPFYRGIPYLRAAIESVRRQTDPRWKLLVLDDHGPEPDAEAVVREFADPRIAFVRHPANLGMAGNWNRGLDLADTDLVTLLHADDELRPRYVERVAATAAAHPTAAAVFTGADIIGPTGRPAFSMADFVKRFLWPNRRRPDVLAGPRVIEALCVGNFLMCPTACYRKSVLGHRRFGDRWRFVLDLELFTGLLMDGESLVLDPARLYAYRRHPDNATEAYTQTDLRFAEETAFYDELAARLAWCGWHRAAGRARAKPLVRLNAAHRALGDLLAGRLARAASRLATILG